MFRRFAGLILAVVVCFALAGPAHAKTVTIATGEWAPYVSSELPEGGYTSEIISHALLAVGIEAQFEYMPWPRAEKMVSSGQYVAASPYMPTDARKEFGIFSEPFALSRNVFFYMKKNISSLQWEKFEDLKQYRIGGVQGYFYVPWFSEAGLNVDYASSATTNFKKLFMGRVDLVPENELVGLAEIARLYPGEEDAFGRSEKALSENELTLMASKFHPDGQMLIDKFNEGFAQIKADGTLDRILKKYGLQ